MKFSDIKKLTRDGNYCVDVPLAYLMETMHGYMYERRGIKLNIDPDYQRDHVWTEEQQIRYVEFLLKGGTTNKTFYFNCPGWMKDFRGPFELVDGKQRLHSLMKFFNNELKVFGCYFKEFEDTITPLYGVKFHINDLPSRKEVLQWYIDMNSGGTVHTVEEIERVKELIKKECK